MLRVTAFMGELLVEVIGSLAHNWLPLTAAIIIASVVKVYVNTEKLKSALLRRSNVSIPASVAFGAFTPLCACGTTAVIIGMLTTTLPWGPVMAFLTSSPLMSPSGFIMLSGIVSLNFAIALAVASIIIGLVSGYVTHMIEARSSFLDNQTRISREAPAQPCGCSTPPQPPVMAVGQLCCAAASAGAAELPVSAAVTALMPVRRSAGSSRGFAGRIRWRELWHAFVTYGLKRILLFYAVFVAIGYLVNAFIPGEIIVSLFSANNILAVPLAAIIGLPLYVSGGSSVPLINTLMAGGASGGAMLAFMITGPGTSAWVIAGIASFLKRRVITLYILFILVGGILLGYLYDLILTAGI